MANPPVARRNAVTRVSYKPDSDDAPTLRRLGRPALVSDRRSQILQAATRLFAEFGFETTSVRQIADSVNILAGSLYHHFATKEDILHEILHDFLARVMKDQLAILQLAEDAEFRLVASVIARFRDAVVNWEAYAIFYNESEFFRRRPEFSYVQAFRLKTYKMQETILADGVRTGLFRSDTDPYMMIGTIARILSSAADWFRAGTIYSSEKPEDYTFERVVSMHVDYVLRLVRTPARLEYPVPEPGQ